MGVTLDVPPGVLAAAKKEWADAVDELAAAWRSLHRTSTGSLSREVAAALETFRGTWVDDLSTPTGSFTSSPPAWVTASTDESTCPTLNGPWTATR